MLELQYKYKIYKTVLTPTDLLTSDNLYYINTLNNVPLINVDLVK